MQQQTICIRKIKDIALSNLPATHPLRTILLAEKEYITIDEFRAKLDIWLNLLDFKN